MEFPDFLGNPSLFGFSFVNLPNKLKIITQYRQNKKIDSISFADISKEVKDICDKLNKNIDINKQWINLQTLFKQEHFHQRIKFLHNNERKEGEDLVNKIRDFSKKESLSINDIESLNNLINEFQLLDRFSIESPQKRKLLIATAVGLSAPPVISLVWNKIHSPSPIEWKYISTFDNTSGFILSSAMDDLSKLVRKMTDNKFIIEKAGLPGNITDSDELLRKISDGDLDCGVAGVYYSENKSGLLFGTSIPFGLNPEEQIAWHRYKYKNLPAMQYVYQEIYNLKIIPMPLIATGHQAGGFFSKEIKEIKDFNGVRMRIPGLGGKVLINMNKEIEIWGLIKNQSKLQDNSTEKNSPSSRSIDELFINGHINAFEFTGPHDDYKIIQKILNNSMFEDKTFFYHWPGWWEPGTTFELQINKSSWEALGESYQQILRAACNQIFFNTLADYNIKNNEYLEKIKREKNIKVKPFGPKILRDAEDKTKKYLESMSSNNSEFREAYTIWNGFKSTWFNYNLANSYKTCSTKK